MLLPKFLLYYHDNSKIVLFDNGQVIQVFEHRRCEEAYTKIALHQNNIHFQYENHSFAKLCDNKIIPQHKKLSNQIIGKVSSTIHGKKYEIAGKYEFTKKYVCVDSKKNVSIPKSSDKICYAMYHFGDKLLCLMDWYGGYSETPDSQIIIFDLNSQKITDIIKLGMYAGALFSATKYNDKLYLLSTKYDVTNVSSASGDHFLLFVFDGLTYTKKYIYIDKNENICQTKSLGKMKKNRDLSYYGSSAENFIYLTNREKSVIYNILNGDTHWYNYPSDDNTYFHSFVPVFD